MARVNSTMVRLGKKAPGFNLPDTVSGKVVSPTDVKGNINDIINHPHDAPDKMKETALRLHYPFPYLYDESQDTAKAYDAACTPDFFIYDKNLQLVYRGQLDDSRPGNEIPVTGKDIRHALDCLLNNNSVPAEQRPSIGCNVKWK